MERIAAAVICILAAMLLFAGCMQQAQEGTTVTTTAPPETTRTTVGTTPTITTAPPLTTSTVDVIPPEKALTVTVLRDQTSTNIIVRFDGGKGQGQVRQIDVKVTRSDGQVLTNTLKARVGEELQFAGTRGADRVEVWVSFVDGSRYKLMDRLYDYYTR